MNFKIVGNNYNNHKDKLISLVNSLATNTGMSEIFDIPSDMIYHINNLMSILVNLLASIRFFLICVI